jgi:large subunit ribosomal protein L23
MIENYQVIKRPLISEKSTALAEVGAQYAFEVSKDANKFQIRDAVQNLFNVKVLKVRTMVMHGKVKRTAKALVQRPGWKKAVVTLAEGQKIDFFKSN